jgi:hypothetical protein
MDPESKRARILRRVLDFINEGDWDDGEGFLIFGSDAYDKHLGIEHEDDEPTTYFDEFLRRLATEVKKVGGAEEIARRISLSPVNRGLGDVDLGAFFARLSPAQRGQIARTVSSVAEDLVRNPKSDIGRVRDTSDEIDASLAAEAVDQLENSYRRLVTLDELKRPATPFDGSEYFEEAHRCELAGQRISAAVPCRAVLEAALINAIDQNGWIKNQTSTHQRSYIGAMLLDAKRIGLIDGSRFTQGMRIRDAGDAAIHNLIEFQDKFSKRVQEIIDDTRKLIEDLCSPEQRD